MWWSHIEKVLSVDHLYTSMICKPKPMWFCVNTNGLEYLHKYTQTQGLLIGAFGKRYFKVHQSQLYPHAFLDYTFSAGCTPLPPVGAHDRFLWRKNASSDVSLYGHNSLTSFDGVTINNWSKASKTTYNYKPVPGCFLYLTTQEEKILYGSALTDEDDAKQHFDVLINPVDKLCYYMITLQCNKPKVAKPDYPSSQGSKGGCVLVCARCQGTGKNKTIRLLGPSKILQKCHHCKGTGEYINDIDRCTACMGEKVASESQLFEVSIKRGMQNGEMMPLIPLTLPGKGNKAPDMIILQTLPHPKFKRNRDDLFYQHKLSLRDALYGCQFILTHLDKRQLLVKLHPGDVSKLDQFKLIENEGMPKSPGSSMKGKLYIHLTVEFRDSLTVEECNVLKKVLPPKPSMQTANIDDCVETTLYDLKFEQEI